MPLFTTPSGSGASDLAQSTTITSSPYGGTNLARSHDSYNLFTACAHRFDDSYNLTVAHERTDLTTPTTSPSARRTDLTTPTTSQTRMCARRRR